MKLTWFGGTTLRIHIGGRILVADPAGISGVDVEELASGADRVFTATALPAVDPLEWRPRRPSALIAEEGPPEVFVHSVGAGATLVDAVGEPPLLLLAAAPGGAGSWAQSAVAVAFSAAAAESALDVLQPRLIAVAAPESDVERAFAELRDRLKGTVLVALEPGLALEV